MLYRKNDSSQGGLTVEGYADADWAGFPFDRRSTSGYCTFVGSNLVTCNSQKQSVVARSSAEAEYRAMALVAQQQLWIKILLSEMGFPITRPMELHCKKRRLFTSLPIQCFMRGPNILKWIVILLVKGFS